MPGGQFSPKKLQQIHRQRRAVKLRTAGYSLREIAIILSKEFDQPRYNHTSVQRDIERALEHVVSDMHDNAQALLNMDLIRLDFLFKAWWPHAVGEDPRQLDSDTSDTAVAAVEDDGYVRRTALLKVLYSKVVEKLQSLQTPEKQGMSVTELGSLMTIAGSVIREMRAEEEFKALSAMPDKEAARIILEVMTRRARLLNYESLDVNLNMALIGKVDHEHVHEFDKVSDSDLDLIIANFQAAIAPRPVIEGQVLDSRPAD